MVTNPRHLPGRAAAPPGLPRSSAGLGALSRPLCLSLFPHFLGLFLGRHRADDSGLLTTASGRREPKNNHGSEAQVMYTFCGVNLQVNFQWITGKDTSENTTVASTFKFSFNTPSHTESTGDDMQDI